MKKIIIYPNPILTTPCVQFDFNNPAIDPIQIADELIMTCHDNKGIGLAANQIGYPYRVFCTIGAESFVFFNPKIVSEGTEKIDLIEACLSVPGVSVKVKRAGEVRVRFQTPSGLTTTKTFNGLTAKTIQHEIDHLDGIMFFNRANRYHRDKAMKGYYNGK
jgi:peptide deformylase